MYILDRLPEVEARYTRAIKEKDKKELAYFRQFGNDERHITENAAAYEQWLSMGYTGRPRLTDVGWLTNGSHKELKPNFETITAFTDGRFGCEILLLRHPNGQWTNGLHLCLSESGSYSSPSIWGEIYATRQDALNAAIDYCISEIERSDIKSDKKYLQPVRALRMEAMQQDLFAI